MASTDTFSSGRKTLGTSGKIMIGLVLALAVVTLGMYFWKEAAVGKVEDRLVAVQAQEAQKRTELIERARQLDAREDVEALKRFSTPLAWAIRRELMASNLDQIDQYLSELVQMPGFQSAVLANSDGKVIVATDRKNLAGAFSSIYPVQYLQATAVGVEPAANGRLRAIVPIMGLNRQLGTLVVEYVEPAYSLK